LLESGERLCVFQRGGKANTADFPEHWNAATIHTPGVIIPPHEASGQLHIAFAISKADFAAWEIILIRRHCR